MANGHYAHFGLREGIEFSLRSYFYNYPNEVKFDISVDGLPLAKSSSSQFWPIMGSVVSDCYTDPFVIGIFHGMKKPADVNEFLRPLVDELKHLQQEGFVIDNKNIKVTLNAIIADAPAKAFVTQVKGHTGYFGCSKCIQEGDFLQNRVIFPEVNSTERTDESFRLKQHPEHHIGNTCLEKLKIGMVSQVPLDYAHLTCLGCLKRLIQRWVKGKRDVRLQENTQNSINASLIVLRPFITSEFARLPRSLHEIDRWKATELRQFLLYTGPVVLRNLLPVKYYEHFVVLSVAIRILADPEYCTVLIDYAQSLLTWFVSNYGSLYGHQFLSYNVHNLVHLCNDVRKFGPVDNFSSFKYENNMQKIKNQLRTSGKPLEQIFPDTDCVSEVSACWLRISDNKAQCWWPERSKNVASLISSCSPPVESKWVLYNVEIERYCSNLDKARKVAGNPTYTSTDDELLGRGKRITMPQQDQSTSDEESTDPGISVGRPPSMPTVNESVMNKSATLIGQSLLVLNNNHETLPPNSVGKKTFFFALYVYSLDCLSTQ
ncbi:uncharacterized protein LOC125501871 [Athalia rosae]|uniref:uncharacterized protein LOC125501871 n=1 Tax=Athalia rosae TaxID=37344 RepID=UPI0020340C7D|nr:uncharacterized protein LOC125501871 [Athalia rosae]